MSTEFKKTVIACKGIGGQGKTTALKKLYERIKEKYPKMSPQTFLIDKNGDIKVIFTIQGVKIGFETQGDPSSRITGSIDDFVNEGCELIVCACRTKGETYNKLFEIDPPVYRRIEAPNFICDQENLYDMLNDLYADSLLQMIDKILNGSL